MLASTSVLIKTDGGREALSAHRYDLQMRQRHLLILINGSRTVEQLHQLLVDWADMDELLAGLRHAGMVEALPEPLAELEDRTAEMGGSIASIAHIKQPLIDAAPACIPAQTPADHSEPLRLTAVTLARQTRAVREADMATAHEPHMMSTRPLRQPCVPLELADVLPNVIKVELMRLVTVHFGAAADAAMPLLRACREDTASLCEVIAACSKVAAPLAGECAAARFVDAAMRAMAQRGRAQ